MRSWLTVIGGIVVASLLVVLVVVKTSVIQQIVDISGKQEEERINRLPKQQQELIAVVDQYAAKFDQAKHQVQEAVIREERKGAFAKVLKDRKAEQWEGKLDKIRTDSKGNAWIEVEIADNIVLRTHDHYLSDREDNTMIKSGTDMYKSLVNLEEGDDVLISGTFVNSEQDYLSELGVTTKEAMVEPIFLFKFISVERAKYEQPVR